MVVADLPAVTDVFRRAFLEKLTAAAPSDPGLVARLFAEAALAGGDAWVADDGAVLAVVTFQDHKLPWYGHADIGLVRRIRPRSRGLRAMLFLLLFHAVDFPASELYLESMAVVPEARGRGVGGALLAFADDEARRRGRRSVSLYCIRANPRARALYVRHGYRIVRSDDLWWCRGLLGFRITDMLRREPTQERTS